MACVFFVHFLCCGCDPPILVVWKLYWFSGFFSLSQNVTQFEIQPPPRCTDHHRHCRPRPLQGGDRGILGMDSTGAGVWNEGNPIAIYIYWEFCKSNIYIHFSVLTTVKCEHVKIMVHYDTSHFHFMQVYPVYSCLMYCWFIASEYLQLLVSIVSTYWFIHTISTYIHRLWIFLHSPPQVNVLILRNLPSWKLTYFLPKVLLNPRNLQQVPLNGPLNLSIS